jgi:branched-chain amino acid transport system permease protein
MTTEATGATSAKTPAKAPKKENGGVRGWYTRQSLPVRIALGVVFAALAFLLPYVGEIPLIGPQIVTQGIDWPSALFNMSYYVLLAWA